MNLKGVEKRIEKLEERLAPKRPTFDLRTVTPEEWTALAHLRHVVRREPGKPAVRGGGEVTEAEWKALQHELAASSR